MTLLSVIGFFVLLQVIVGVALGLYVAYLAMRDSRRSLNSTRQLRRYHAPHTWKAARRSPQAGD